MPRPCTVCHHPERAAIDEALVTGLTYRNISIRFDIPVMALFRHKQGHLPVTLMQAHEADTVAKADDLLAQLRTLQAKAEAILATTEQAGHLMVALAAIREARSCLELLAKLVSLLKDPPAVLILHSPEWRQVRRALMEALTPFPEARAAVTSALVTLEASPNGPGG